MNSKNNGWVTFWKEFNIVEDPDGYLQKLGELLLAQLPPTSIHYHFVIIDSPELNSFGIMGGRIYIHRRMIAFTQNEDELAALVGHEIGHMAAHQVAVNVSDWFRELGITEVGDREDILKKWNQLKDNSAKIRSQAAAKREKQDQFIADRIGLYAMARAGYAPSRAIEFADRSFQTKGKTGGFWSDLFGTTSTESKRLREITRTAAPLAKECIAADAPDTSHFNQWQQAVIASKRVALKEDVPGLVSKVALQPPLRGDIDYLQFSPDGRYLLAQDESSIFVLSGAPLTNLFRIDAPDTHTAQFSLDSQAIVFYDKELRVEKWDITTQQRTSMHELTVPECYQTALSPSGNLMACVAIEPEGNFDLQIVEVSTNKIIYTRKKIYALTWVDEWLLWLSSALGGELPSIFALRFSPDDHYFLVGHNTAALAYDLKLSADVHLSTKVKEAMSSSFAFLSPDEIAGLTGFGNNRQVVRMKFPSGDRVDEFKLPIYGELSSIPKGDYLIVRQSGPNPVVIVDLKTKKGNRGFKVPGFAIYDQVFAGEQASGEIAFFSPEDNTVKARVQLPESPLETSRTAAFSPDGKWLAVSGSSRGALWNLETGARIFLVHSFDGACFDEGHFIAQFPKSGADPSRVFDFDPVTHGSKKLYDVEQTKSGIGQQGALLIGLSRDKGSFTAEPTLEVRDVISNKKLWDRRLGKGRARFFAAGKTLTLLVSNFDAIKAAVKENAGLTAKLNDMDAKKDAYLIQSLDAVTGNLLGNVLVDTGKLSFVVRTAVSAGDTVFATATPPRTRSSETRVHVYSLKTGRQQGAVFGRLKAVSATGGQMLVENEKGAADLYDTASLRSLAHLTFPSGVAQAAFLQDGTTLAVLTADQKVYKLQLPATRADAEKH